MSLRFILYFIVCGDSSIAVSVCFLNSCERRWKKCFGVSVEMVRSFYDSFHGKHDVWSMNSVRIFSTFICPWMFNCIKVYLFAGYPERSESEINWMCDHWPTEVGFLCVCFRVRILQQCLLELVMPFGMLLFYEQLSIYNYIIQFFCPRRRRGNCRRVIFNAFHRMKFH